MKYWMGYGRIRGCVRNTASNTVARLGVVDVGEDKLAEDVSSLFPASKRVHALR